LADFKGEKGEERRGFAVECCNGATTVAQHPLLVATVRYPPATGCNLKNREPGWLWERRMPLVMVKTGLNGAVAGGYWSFSLRRLR